ncbi:MAG: glycolate oxidase subunit GlcF [Mariprofundaceae bacterium]
MQTKIFSGILATESGREADKILRSCVHCGFCTATCPTYQLLGNELDGPRGRIYLIKDMLEGGVVTEKTQTHLDRCLSCRSCETTCPSGVEYNRLLSIGRDMVEEKVERGLKQRLLRKAMLSILPYRQRFAYAIRLAGITAPLLPKRLRNKLPVSAKPAPWPEPRHPRRMLILEGCVQPSLAPNINAATARVLDRLGISLLRAPKAGCCGAVHHHLSESEAALDFMRANIDAWLPDIESGAEAIVINVSACALEVKEYGQMLRNDPAYADKAARVSALARDIGEVLAREDVDKLNIGASERIAFHAPCTLQHGLGLHDVVAGLLSRAGFSLLPVTDAHLCCGSAGTYSILQTELSGQLRDNKLAALQAAAPDAIATANIGCLAHLQSGTDTPVKHWIELLDSGMQQGGQHAA